MPLVPRTRHSFCGCVSAGDDVGLLYVLTTYLPKVLSARKLALGLALMTSLNANELWSVKNTLGLDNSRQSRSKH